MKLTISAAGQTPWGLHRLLVLAAGLLMLTTACTNDSRVEIISPGGITLVDVQIEIANTDAERETGLMYRQHLDSNAGMLFVFKQPEHLSFWMKNTEIPLDMIFANDDRTIIGIVANAEPFSERQLSVNGDSQYVLEVNGGFARRHGIAPGDKLKFVGFVPQAIE
jgi:uncharacterized protein